MWAAEPAAFSPRYVTFIESWFPTNVSVPNPVAGVSTGEMLHRQATRLVPPDSAWAAVGSSLGDEGSTGRHRGALAEGEAARAATEAGDEGDVRTIGLIRTAEESAPGRNPDP